MNQKENALLVKGQAKVEKSARENRPEGGLGRKRDLDGT